MEMPSSGPKSLISSNIVDTGSFISYEDRDTVSFIVGDASYSTIIAWGVDQVTDFSTSSDESVTIAYDSESLY